MNYRNFARLHLKSAEDELGSSSDGRLKYAALELRMAMEALTYDRALSYKDEFPPSEYETWQPRKIMSVLLNIDPKADKDSSLAIGLEEQYGVPAPRMNSLGSEKVLSMSVLRKHYDALGSYLHVQSMKQVREGTTLDFNRMRERCKEIAAFTGQVLSSPIFNVTFGHFASLNCIKCGSPIRKRLCGGHHEAVAECHQCKATYTITAEGDGKVKWKPHQHEVECASGNCHEKICIWHHELEIGRHWICKNCNGKNSFVLAIDYEDQSPE